MNNAMIYITWYLRRFANWLSLAGVLGLALLIVAGLVYQGLVLPSQQSLQQKRQDLLEQKRLAATTPIVDAKPKQTEAELVSHFYAQFPKGTTLPDWLKLIDKAAHDEKLALDLGDYKLTTEKKGRVTRYEIQLPVVGDYAQIRRFIASVLKQIPVAALNDITLKRETSDAPKLEANIEFVLFLKGDTWH